MSEISQNGADVSGANEQSRPTLMLIDGHALVHRAFHAFPEDMSTQTGEPTNAVFGFARMLLDALKNIHPDYAAVTFDRPTPTFRHLEFAGYKAQRPPLPDTMRPQFGRIRQLVEAFGMPIYELDGFEADDVMGTLACQAKEQSVSTVIITGDLDTLQLVDSSVRVTYASKPLRGELAYYDEAAVRARYSFAPAKLVDYKALVGDKSDNIPGVPGIGDKTATNLINQYGSLEGILEHVDELPPKIRATLSEHEALARQCKRLATIVTDVPITLDLNASRVQSPNRDEVLSLFRELEFYSMVDRVSRFDIGQAGAVTGADASIATSAPRAVVSGGQFTTSPTTAGAAATPAIGPEQLSLFVQDEVEAEAEQGADLPTPGVPRILTPAQTAPAHTNTMVIDSEDGLAILARSLRASGAFAIDLETSSEDALNTSIVGISLSMGKNEAYYLPVGHVTTPNGQAPGSQLPLERVLAALKPLLEDAQLKKFGHNAKFDMLALAQHGVWLRGLTCDSMVGAYLLNPGRRGLGLKDQAFEHLGIIMTPITDLIGSGSKQISMAQVPIRAAADYAGADADMTYRLAEVIEARLKERQLYKLFSDVEMPLIPVLTRMELAGILVDPVFLRRMAAELDEQIKALEQAIYEAVGHQFNINSTRQLGDILFGELKLPPIRRTKTGYSVDAEVLDTLKGAHPAIDNLLEYRQLGKLKSTYVDGLLQLIHPTDGRVHTSFNQTIASTGRLSSSQPNLQNIPIRTEVGRRIRRAFLADPGCVLLTADYSQVELRILAHITREPALVAAFERNEDVHAATAARLYKVPLDEVTPAMRRIAKTINFGVLYGQSPFGLARVADISQTEASEYIRNYEATFPLVKAYVEGTKAFARSQGYVETLLGRRRYMPDLLSLPMVQRQAAEREAINMPIQGTNADIIKIAMVRLQHHFEELGLRTRMILQVHDELVFEAAEDEVELVKGLVRATMEEAMTLSVPLKVDIKIGPNWYEVVPAK
ncbi:MAG TPA: DNA polymerase I [Ktedonobacterales bacterium]|jgi:DNA polymerase-1